LIEFLEKNGLRLSTAESCTAGLIASLLAEVPGSGQVLDRGFVVYTPQAKHECLGVSYETIEKYGLSSAEVVTEMVLGALENRRHMVAIATTGLAEAEGEMDGVIYFGWAMRGESGASAVTERVKFPGSRNQVREAAARYALEKVPGHVEHLSAGAIHTGG
jgi:PncC family amidohydrolase